jgi:uncharacterized cupin superfamily protein
VAPRLPAALKLASPSTLRTRAIVSGSSETKRVASMCLDNAPYSCGDTQSCWCYLGPAAFTVCEEATMARGSKVFRPADVSESNASSYPEPFREGQRKRYTRRLGDYAGLKNYGVNLVRVLPGGQSSARHTHSKQDECVYVLEGEFVLVTDAGRETVGPGTCIGFPAGTGDGHHFLNLTQKDAVFLVIGDRTAGDEVTYPDIDLELKAGPDGVRGYHRKDGTPYPRAARD